MATKESCEINPECARQLGAIAEQLKDINGKLDKFDLALHGNGKPGLLISVDRLTQAANRNRWFVRAIAGVVITLTFTFCWNYFTTPKATAAQAVQTTQTVQAKP